MERLLKITVLGAKLNLRKDSESWIYHATMPKSPITWHLHILFICDLFLRTKFQFSAIVYMMWHNKTTLNRQKYPYSICFESELFYWKILHYFDVMLAEWKSQYVCFSFGSKNISSPTKLMPKEITKLIKLAFPGISLFLVVGLVI